MVDLVRDDKLSKADIMDALPAYLHEEQLMQTIDQISQRKVNAVKEQFEELRMQVDHKIVSIRQEFDMSLLRKWVEKKADRTELSTMFDNHDYKLLTLDSNFLLLSQDFETFHKNMIKMQKHVQELRDVNKDVLLGGKAVNCLSCNKAEDTRKDIKGKDGRLYWGTTLNQNGPTGADEEEDLEDFENLRTNSPPRYHPRRNTSVGDAL